MSCAALPGAFRSPASTIGTSMSDASTGTAPPRRDAGSGPRSPSSPPSSRSTGSSSASNAARSATSFWRTATSARALLWTAMTAYTASFGALSVLRYRSYNVGRFDLGNMTQAVWATAHGHPLAVTNLEGEQVSRLGSHVDPILAVFAPLRRLWPRPAMPLTAPAVAIAL